MKQPDTTDNGKIRWKPNSDDIAEIIREHKIWLESEGQKGYRAAIYNADLSGADLKDADLRGAIIRDTYLYGANLSGTALTQAEGIEARYLSRANLSGADLPRNVDLDEQLAKANKISRKARRAFYILLILLHYSWITLAAVADANLLSQVDLIPILPLRLLVPSVWFFCIMPLILFVLFIFFHMKLQRNWRSIAGLPAIYPDGTPVYRNIHQWFANKLVKRHIKTTTDKDSLLARIHQLLSIFTIRWLMPCTIIWYWFRYLTHHDWTISGFHIVIIALSIMLSGVFKKRMCQTLRRDETKRGGIFLRVIYLAVFIAVFLVATLDVIKGVPKDADNGSYRLAPRIAEFFGYDLFADFSNGEISRKPDNWTGDDASISLVEGAALRDLDVPYSLGQHAFLVNADMRYADLVSSNLDSVDFRGATLIGAKFAGARLIGTNLQGANLTGADLSGADISGANLRDVTGLTINALHRAENWLYAIYGGSILDSLNLPPDHNERIHDRDLSGYDLQGVNFKGASLAEFNLTGANLQGTDLTGVDLSGANLFLTDLRGAVGLDKNGLQAASNWLFALYDELFLNEFGLPAEHNELAARKDLRKYNFEGLNLAAVNFKNANLRNAILKDANLAEADFQDADLYAANLTGADLTGANFQNASLLDTDIKNADLTAAINLTMDQIRWAIYDSTTVFPEYLRGQAATRLKKK